MKDIQYHESFAPKSCSSNSTHRAATLGAGVQDGELFTAMAKHDSLAVGGQNNVGELFYYTEYLVDSYRMLEWSGGLPVVATALRLAYTEWEPTTSSRRSL